jgi:CelD/BcsL family acetyltransferase involved in cellulose biosynthesis
MAPESSPGRPLIGHRHFDWKAQAVLTVLEGTAEALKRKRRKKRRRKKEKRKRRRLSLNCR